MATCVDLAGAAYPPRTTASILRSEGMSLGPPSTATPLGRERLFWEHEGNRAIRDGKWKLVAMHRRPWELYDMDADRTELHDLAAAMPATGRGAVGALGSLGRSGRGTTVARRAARARRSNLAKPAHRHESKTL